MRWQICHLRNRIVNSVRSSGLGHDEVQNVTDNELMSQTLVALGDALAHEEPHQAPGGTTMELTLPVAVFLTGLPEFRDYASAPSRATFARRFETELLDPISDDA